MAILAACMMAVPATCLAQMNGPMPDVMVLVMSGVIPSETDDISFTYTKEVSKETAKADLMAVLNASGWKAKGAKIINKDGATSVGFQVKDLVNWTNGLLPVEPFAVGFKRFNLMQVTYMLGGGFTSHTLRDYSNKYVDVRLETPNASTYTYAIRIKDHSYDKLDLPTMDLPKAAQPNKTPEQQTQSGSKIWMALVIALAAGVIVFIAIGRTSRK